MTSTAASSNVLNVRKIVITGVLAAIAILLGVTRLGFIPVPNVSGNATIMHVPAIIGGVMEGPIVGLVDWRHFWPVQHAPGHRALFCRSAGVGHSSPLYWGDGLLQLCCR